MSEPKKDTTEFEEAANAFRDFANELGAYMGVGGMSETASKALDAAIRVSKEKKGEEEK